MKRTINLYEFRDAFRDAGRLENFSYQGLELLFDYIEQYEQDCGVEIEFDVIALCCEFSEDYYSDIAADYDIDLSDIDDDDSDAQMDAVLDYLNENTSVCGYLSNGYIVYAAF